MHQTILSAGVIVCFSILAATIYAEPDIGQGEALYERHCSACHGENGDGSGEAERYLSPKARDFTAGVYKFRSTPSGTPPTDEDLYRTVRRGISGTSMPSFARLSDQELTSVITHVKSFSDIFEDDDLKEPPIKIGHPPRSTTRSIRAGAKVYKELECFKCHGESGKGDGPSAHNLTNDWDQPIRPYDLTRGPMLMKGGATSQAIYRTFMAGLDGTPMPSYMDDLPEKKRWPLVHYIQSLSGIIGSKITDEPGGISTLIAANFSSDISLNIDDKLWKKVQASTVPLRPIWARDKWPYKVELKIAKGPSQIAFRFVWQDTEPNKAIRVTTDFMDGVALQFVPRGMAQDYVGIPFFGMGDLKEKVHIWNWKAAVLNKGSENQAFTVLEANGFGTLEDQPAAAQTVDGTARWKDGTWTVLMRQTFDNGSPFNTHQSIPIAIAAFDGNERDRAGQKSVSEWMELKLK